EVEVLDRGQLAVEQGIMAREPDLLALGGDLERSGARDGEAGAQPEQGRLPGAVRSCHQHEPTAVEAKVEAVEDALVPVALAQPPWGDERGHQTTASTITKAQKTTLITPFMVKNARSSRRRSSGRTSECS